MKGEIDKLRTQLNDSNGLVIDTTVDTQASTWKLEIQSHFTKEAQARQQVLRAEQVVKEHSFSLYKKQSSYDKLRSSHSETRLTRQKEEILKLINQIRARKQQIDQECAALEELEKGRE